MGGGPASHEESRASGTNRANNPTGPAPKLHL
jgi:hypothetical protein